MAGLEKTIRNIKPIDQAAQAACFAHWDSLCKPLRGMGDFEALVARIGAMERTDRPHVHKRAVVIMGADNGVVAEGVSQTGSEVTRQVLENMQRGISSVCVMSKRVGADVIPVDIGMNAGMQESQTGKKGAAPMAEAQPFSVILDRHIRRGTGNIRTEDAMTREECVRAVETGISVALELAERGYDLLAAGEMGIGNTTTSAACASVLFGVDPQEVTGRGAGLSSTGLQKKVTVIRESIDRAAPDAKDPLSVIHKVGGLDIAGMTGLYLGAAAAGIPILIDGVISGISACFASMLCSHATGYMVATHATAEPAGRMIQSYLQLAPLLFANMHLGEATGAAMVLPMLDLALHLYYDLPSFREGSVEQYEHLI